MNSTYHRSNPDIAAKRAIERLGVEIRLGHTSAAAARTVSSSLTIGSTLTRVSGAVCQLERFPATDCQLPLAAFTSAVSRITKTSGWPRQSGANRRSLTLVSFASAAWSPGSSGESFTCTFWSASANPIAVLIGWLWACPTFDRGAVYYWTRPLSGCTASPPVNPTLCRNKTFPFRVYWATMPEFRPKRINEKAFRWNRVLRFDIRWLQGCGRDQICRASRP